MVSTVIICRSLVFWEILRQHQELKDDCQDSKDKDSVIFQGKGCGKIFLLVQPVLATEFWLRNRRDDNIEKRHALFFAPLESGAMQYGIYLIDFWVL